MSVIAWDGHVLAADKQATNNGLKRTTTKIHRAGECLVAFTGDASQGMLMVDWAPVAVIRPDRTIATYERTPVPVVIEDRFYAAGCGRDYAMAVMHLGLGAVKAVEVACALDAFCGNGMDTLSLESV
jgi:ATP-dependent protease HslVU (ClpYQ) peptidase subunit